jgi:capsular exopolysaccharide synthesis family protein
MSRIHEALKKAEQDRAMAPAAADVVTVTAPPPQAPEAPMPSWAIDKGDKGKASGVLEAPAQTGILAQPSADYLRYDELISKCAHPAWNPDPNMNVFGSESGTPHAAEQFRTLRSRLYQVRNTQNLRTILMTSSVPGEGKTFVTTNLAQSFIRQPDRRALIIDGDLRCARLHVPLGAPNSPGLSDYLRGNVDEFGVIQHGHEGNLCFIAGGSEVSDPSELLSNGRLKKLLDRVTPIFDWVIIDSPPCLPVADSTILANFCDGILLVVRAGSTATTVAQRACQELQGRNVIGVVLNAVEQSHMYGSYYYQGYGYGYVKGEGDKGGRQESKN